jgi:hypothetical protein
VNRLMESALKKYVPRAVKRASLAFELEDVRRALTERFISKYGNFVQSGPFQGMELPTQFCWSDGDRLPKLIGSYEAELHPGLIEVTQREYAVALNIGCAEGYYAVGVARLMQSKVPVIAFDISETAQAICAKAGEINRVTDRLKVAGLCSHETLNQTLHRGRRSLVIIDCEGAELELLRPDLIPGLLTSDLLIECHDWVSRGLTDELRERFSPTHAIELITEGSRGVQNSPFLKELNSFERALAVCEFRPELMHWLFCTAKV